MDNEEYILKDKHKIHQDRFLFILGIIILSDMVLLKDVSDWFVVTVGIIEITFIFALAWYFRIKPFFHKKERHKHA